MGWTQEQLGPQESRGQVPPRRLGQEVSGEGRPFRRVAREVGAVRLVPRRLGEVDALLGLAVVPVHVELLGAKPARRQPVEYRTYEPRWELQPARQQHSEEEQLQEPVPEPQPLSH